MGKYIRDSKFRILNIEERRRFLAELNKQPAKQRLKTLYLLGRYTGLRITEMLSLNIGDVFDGMDIRPELHLDGPRAKGKKRGRTVSLYSKNDILRREIRRYLHARRTSGEEIALDAPLFTTEHVRRSPIPSGEDRLRPSRRTARTRDVSFGRLNRQNASKELSIFCRRAALQPFSWHTLRRTYLTGITDVTGDISLASAAAGHRRSETTLNYIHKDLNRLHQANALLNP